MIFFFLAVAVLVGVNMFLLHLISAPAEVCNCAKYRNNRLFYKYTSQDVFYYVDSVQLRSTSEMIDSLYRTDGEEACREMAEKSFKDHNYGCRLKYFSDQKGGDSLLDLIDSMAIVLSH